MALFSRPASRQPFLLFLEDDASVLTGPDGSPLGELTEEAPGTERRPQRQAFLRSLLPPKAQVQICVGYSRLGIQCQDAPLLPTQEVRDVALRLASTEQPSEPLLVGQALETDAEARGGHILWAAYLPAAEMNEWAAALEGTGLELVNATAWPRALLRGLTGAAAPSRERVVLTLGPGQGRLLFLRGAALVLQRTFRVAPEGEVEDHLALAVEETARTLQFYKQRYRGSAPTSLILVGATSIPPELEGRLRGLGLAAQCHPEPLLDVLHRGLAAERSSGGLDLRPAYIQEAQRRRWLRAALVLVTLSVLAAFTVGGAILRTREQMLETEASKLEAELARKQAADLDRQRAMAARIPLLRLRAAERLQAGAITGLSRLSKALMSPPPEIQLEQVGVQQVPGAEPSWSFQVSGTALTGPGFSVGPLARYLEALLQIKGLELDPLREVSVSDRRVAGIAQPEAQAITRFSLSGRFK